MAGNQRLRAGQLNKRVTIQHVAETRSGSGAVTEAWGTYAQRWASIEYQGGAESLSAGADRTERRALVRMRGDSATRGVTAKMRLLYGPTVFDILAISNVGERGAEMEILAVVRG